MSLAPSARKTDPSTNIQYLKGVGPKVAPLLAKLGIHTVRDLLMHIPRRYEDRRQIPPIGSLRPGQWATVRGRMLKLESRPTRGGMVILRAHLSDRTGLVALTWFNQPWIKRKLSGFAGELIAYGQVREALNGIEINSPEWEAIDEDSEPEDFNRIVPVYPLTEGLAQRNVRRAIRNALAAALDQVEETLPAQLRRSRNLPGIRESLAQIHGPEDDDQRLKARRRLVFEEFLLLQLALQMRRAESLDEPGIAFPISELQKPPDARQTDVTPSRRRGKVQESLAIGPPRIGPLDEEISRMLPFELTGAQKRVLAEIFADMQKPRPMSRLLQGDVGSGKTAVAAAAILAAVRSGYQAALMAPTEVLAEQHYAGLRGMFEPLGISVVLLVGKQTAAQKRRAAQLAADGRAQVAIGTHALIQEGVSFDRLGLVVIDEQHRFGVAQRAALGLKSHVAPDMLVMSATPIPRTLTMALFGDLDLSKIDELPPGRSPIITRQKWPHQRQSVYEGVEQLLARGRQAYIVCPNIEGSEKMQTQAAVDLHYRLQTEVFPHRRIGLLHGQLKTAEKERVMAQFRAGELDVLVCTVVIEVGVDVPNATVMVIEDAHRFGLSQLHQLRGRVGRGSHQSFCILISDTRSEESKARIETLVETTDGFRIAEADLDLRGPGEVIGTQQHGQLALHVADLVADVRVLEEARDAAIEIVRDDPRLEDSAYARIRPLVLERKGEQLLRGMN